MKTNETSVQNIYTLDGKVPPLKAIPFGLQHILAMFVANIAPIIIVAGASGLSSTQTAMLIQSAMIIAGIGTLIQLFPVWKIGSGLPIVKIWLSGDCWCRVDRRYRRGRFGIICQVLDQDCCTDRSSKCCYIHWFFIVICRG